MVNNDIRKRLALMALIGTNILVLLLLTTAAGMTSIEEWNRTFGGTGDEWASIVQQTADGGYVVAGTLAGIGTVDLSIPSEIGVRLIKTDTEGNEQWSRIFSADAIVHIEQTADGGYSIGAPNEIIKTNSNGEKLWNKTFDRRFDVSSIQNTLDEGYLITGAGYEPSNDSFKLNSVSWLIKLDAYGKEQWNETFTKVYPDFGRSAKQTLDSGYVLVGSRISVGPRDILFLKLDTYGREQWNRTFGGNGDDTASSVQQTADGGYIIVGTTEIESHYEVDNSLIRRINTMMWLIKTSANGDEQWNKTLLKIMSYSPLQVQQTRDGGYMISYGDQLIKTDDKGNEQFNRTFSSVGYLHQTLDGGYILGTPGGQFTKIDADGKEQWYKSFGYDEQQKASYSIYSIQQTRDGGYIAAGSRDRDVPDVGHVRNIWLMKISNVTVSTSQSSPAISILEILQPGLRATIFRLPYPLQITFGIVAILGILLLIAALVFKIVIKRHRRRKRI